MVPTQQQDQRQRFLHKVVIITGSSSGIGREAAIQFSNEGASVVIHGQNAERLDETAKLILACGIPAERVLKVLGSLENSEIPEKIVNETLNKFGQIDVLINNAGTASKPGIEDKDRLALDNLDFIYAVNFRSIVQLSLLALPHLKKTKGNVLNIGSLAGTRVSGHHIFYGPMKAALDHWTHGFAQLAAPNVRVNSLNPGPIRTPIFDRANVSEVELKIYANATLLGRFGQPNEMATIMKFLCSDDASYVTGATLLADGGMAVKFL